MKKLSNTEAELKYRGKRWEVTSGRLDLGTIIRDSRS